MTDAEPTDYYSSFDGGHQLSTFLCALWFIHVVTCCVVVADIKAGQGMYYSPASQAFYASNCDFNNYGAPNITYGLSAFPCRDCSVGMVANTVYAGSAAYFRVDNNTSPARGGFVSPMACVTQPGFGYNGRTASKCPVGTYNPPGTLTSCAKCAFGLSTRDDAESQVSAGNCTLAAGFGFHSNSIVPCPIGKLIEQSTTTMLSALCLAQFMPMVAQLQAIQQHWWCLFSCFEYLRDSVCSTHTPTTC